MKRNTIVAIALFLWSYSINCLAEVSQAIAAYDKGDYVTAMQEAHLLAEQGNAVAENLLGLMYFYGHGVSQDYIQAERWFRNSADHGNARAQFNIGLMYENEKIAPEKYSLSEALKRLSGKKEDKYEWRTRSRVLAEEWFRKAAEQGLADAQFKLGVAYSEGAESVKWLSKAAEQGNSDAQFNLGVVFANGQGVAQDHSVAAKWFRKAADQGNADAQWNLGGLYRDGLGVTQDYDQALKLFLKSAEQGNADAQVRIGYMYGTGTGVPLDYEKATAWYRKAAEQGNSIAKDNLRITEEFLKKERLMAKLKKQAEGDGSRGYKYTSLVDFKLDAGKLPISSKVSLSGFYSRVGKLEKIGEYPSREDFGNKVIVITGNADRNSRKLLLSDIACQQAYCPVQILGKLSLCEISIFGKKASNETCVIADEIRLNYNQ